MNVSICNHQEITIIRKIFTIKWESSTYKSNILNLPLFPSVSKSLESDGRFVLFCHISHPTRAF